MFFVGVLVYSVVKFINGFFKNEEMIICFIGEVE